ncbi:hypothetical protein [Okeania sp. KiyG1]|uniref:hypothetical protein n=1 Tax=Okeania sp. KiyG1 TaxID=2720165 RepID=UPI0019211164|nr:hypothetical protein [Okeania sp. KiyG1]GGA13153.1 hypothetical protein CYANOKiyG1_26340 [Okeania sp. KiyG1]
MGSGEWGVGSREWGSRGDYNSFGVSEVQHFRTLGNRQKRINQQKRINKLYLTILKSAVNIEV